MEYKELQTQAKELGLNYVGVSKEDLEKSIQENQSKGSVVAPKETSTKKSKEKNVENEANTAIVFDGNHEVRRYEITEHGEDFVELANEFADNRGYTVKLEKIGVGIICPKCGHEFRPKKVIA